MMETLKQWLQRLLAILLGKKQAPAAKGAGKKVDGKGRKPSDEVYPLF
jgi:hypothetical protein